MTSQAPYPLEQFVSVDYLRILFRSAKHEDLNEHADVSSELLIEPGAGISAEFRTRAAGIACGTDILPLLAKTFTDKLRVDIVRSDADPLEAGNVLARISGTARQVLTVERTALNLLTHLSGIASHTARFVEAAGRLGGEARICDTRKTHLGLRGLEKYAVSCGGGLPHRKGLYDAVLWKDNHLAGIEPRHLAKRITEAIEEGRRVRPTPKFFQVEVDTLEQLQTVLSCPVDMVLLDNMSLDEMRQAVKLKNEVNSAIQLEASGGVTLENVADISATGVDRISVGELTHSAPALDIGLDVME